jgi:DNA repair exonuclease SbcCD nuclease subunit
MKDMAPFRFIHAADLHLDSPFRGLAEVSPRLGEKLHSATFGALDRIVTHTIDSNADFLVIAGDLYDSRDRSLRALVEFRRQMERLAERGLGAYIVHGNHDPLNGWGAEFGMPSNVLVFDGEARVEPVVRNGTEIARVAGISYTRERVTENLARTFRPTLGNVFSIAALHANVGHQSGHADYAPASINDLIAAGFDYWALGHVHNPAVLSESPMIVYPGNPQGRHARETGPRGCFEVTVDDGGTPHLRFVETSVVCWERLDIPIDAHSRLDGLMDSLIQEVRRVAAGFDGPSVLRIRLVGNGPLHSDLNREGVADQLREQLASIVDVESLDVVTGPEVDVLQAVRAQPVAGDLLRLVERARHDSAYRDYLAESLAPLFRRREMPAPGPERLAEWIEKAGGLGVDLLVRDAR